MPYSSEPEFGKVETTRVEGAPQIRLSGECDVYTAPLVQAEVRQLLDRGEIRIIFDLERATFLDSSILRIFLGARREANPLGGRVVLLCRPGFVRRLLSLLEIDRILTVCTPEEWREQVAAVN